MTQKLVSKKELKSIYGVPYGFQHIARLEAAGQFPQRIRLGACRVAEPRQSNVGVLISPPIVFSRFYSGKRPAQQA